MSEKVIYKGRCYTVTRPVDKEDKKLLTPQKQKIAKLYFYKGMSSKDIARILNVDENILQIWYEGEMKRENISEAVVSYNKGKSKTVECTNLDTGIIVIYPSLSATARAIGTRASTVRKALLEGKKYKNYSFKYIED